VPATDIVPGLQAFYDEQVERCNDRGIPAETLGLSHVAVRARTWREYLGRREELERHAISKLVLAEPIQLGRALLELVELIPPFHQRVYRMGLEHFGFVVGDDLERFSKRHRAVLTGQQFQSAANEPVYILFEDYTHVKFHRNTLRDA